MNISVSDGLTSATIIVALVTWWITFRRERAADKAARTAEVLAAFSLSEPLVEASFQLTRRINNGEKVPYDGLDPATERNVITVLDYYEYLCELYESGILSRRTIATIRGRLMVRTFIVCEDYINETRRRQNRLVYESFERFARNFSRATGEPMVLSRVPSQPEEHGPDRHNSDV